MRKIQHNLWRCALYVINSQQPIQHGRENTALIVVGRIQWPQPASRPSKFVFKEGTQKLLVLFLYDNWKVPLLRYLPRFPTVP